MPSSGNIGFCKLVGHTSSIIIEWDDSNTVIGVDCDHEHCGYATSCELYQRCPVGFRRDFPTNS